MQKSISNRDTAKLDNGNWLQRRLGRMYARHGMILVLGLAFQWIVLLTMIVIPLTTKMTGDIILLRTEPVDPRDLFRGDYVILRYDFSRLRGNAIDGMNIYELQGKTIFVSIEPESDGTHWRASNFSLQKPSAGKFLCGQIKGANQIEFGIESYFVQQGQGFKYENAARNRTLSAEIALSHHGKAVLKRLVVENTPHVAVAEVAPKLTLGTASIHQFTGQAERRLVSRRIDENIFAKKAKESETFIIDTSNSTEDRSVHIKGSSYLPSDSFSYEELRTLVPNSDTQILLYSRTNFLEKIRIPNQPNHSQVPNADLKLSVPIFLRLYVYGYHNVWELDSIIDPHQSELELEIDSHSQDAAVK